MYPLILCYIAPTNPLILLSFLTYEVIGSIIPPNSDHIVYDVAGAAHTLYQPHVRCKCKWKTFGEWNEISCISRQKFTKLKEETKETPPWKEVAR